MTPIIIYLTSPTKPLDTSLCRIITDDTVNMLRSRHMGWPSLASDSDGMRSHHSCCPVHKEILCMLPAPNQPASNDCEELLA